MQPTPETQTTQEKTAQDIESLIAPYRNADGTLGALKDLLDILDEATAARVVAFAAAEYEPRRAPRPPINGASSPPHAAGPQPGVHRFVKSAKANGANGASTPPPPEETEAQQSPFPMKALPASLRAMAKATATTTQTEPHIAALSGLAIHSGALGGSVEAIDAAPGKKTGANLFFVTGAPISYGKGEIARNMGGPILEADRIANETWRETGRPQALAKISEAEAEIAGAKAKLAASARGGKGALTIEQKEEVRNSMRKSHATIAENRILADSPPCIITGSATGAALGRDLARNGEHLFIFTPEAGDALRVLLGRYTSDGGGDIDLMLKGYSRENHSDSRMGRNTPPLHAPCISCLLFAQPHLIAGLLTDEEAVDRGLTTRFLYPFSRRADVPMRPKNLPDIPTETRRAWERVITSALSQRGRFDGTGDYDMDSIGKPLPIPCDPEAVEALRLYDNETRAQRNGKHRAISNELGRLCEQAIRISVNLAVMDATERGGIAEARITAAVAERAIKIMRWLAQETIAAHTPAANARMQDRAEKLRAILLALPDQSAWSAALDRNHGYKRAEQEQLAKAFPHLIQHEEIKEPGSKTKWKTSAAKP